MRFTAFCTSLALPVAAVQLVTPAHCACTSEGSKKIISDKNGISFFIDHSRVDPCLDPIVGNLSMKRCIHAWMLWADPAFKCSRVRLTPMTVRSIARKQRRGPLSRRTVLGQCSSGSYLPPKPRRPELPTGRGKEHT